MVDFRSIAHGYESPSEWIREPGITDEQSQVRQAIFDAARWRALTNVARNYPGRVRHAFQQRIKELQKQGDHEKATKMRDEFALLEPCLAAGKQVATGAHADPRGIWGLVQSITFRILQNVGKDRLPEAQQGIHRGKTDYRLDDVWDPDETYCAVELPTTLQHELRKTRMLPARRAVAGPGYPGADHHHSYPFNFRWNVVVDPTPSSEMVDIFFRATFADLANMIRGGLDPVRENLTLFTNWHDARAEAERRFAGRQNTTAGGRRPGAGIDLLQFIQLSKELQDLGWAVQTFLPDQLLTLLHREADWPDLKPEALRKMLRVLRALQRAGIAGADEAHDTIQTYLRIRSGGEPSSSQTLGLYTGGYEASGPGAGIDLLHFIRLYREMQSLGWAVQEQLEKLVRQEADFDDLNPNALRMMLPVLRSLQRAGVADADETHDAIKTYLENPDAYHGDEERHPDEDTTAGPNRDEDLWMADVAEDVKAARAKDPLHYVPTYVRIPGRDRPETILYAGNPAAIVWDITRPHPRQGYPSLRTAMGRLNLFANRVAVFSDKQFMAKYDAAREMLQRLYADGKLNSQRRDQLRSRIPAQMLSAMETQQRRRERGEPRGRENPAGELSLRLVAPALRAVAGYLGDNSY